MPLPKINTPTYELLLPLTKKTIKYRPFLVKEEKLLLLAKESNDEKIIVDSVKQIINNCSLTKLDLQKLPILDIEYLFLNLRIKSIGEIVELQYKCNNSITNDKNEIVKCNHITPIIINLLEVKPTFNESHTNKIELEKDVGMILKYPNFSTLSLPAENKIEMLMSIIYDLIEYVYDKDELYYPKDITKTEMMEFIENLNAQQFSKVVSFFETMPKLTYNIDFNCKKCGYNENITLNGLQSFFG